MATAVTPEISVVIPCLNEAENADAIAAAVGAQLEAANATYEIIFIDNGSTDDTVAIVKRLCQSDPRIRLIVNTRNFGQMRSPTHAVYQTSGDAVIGISADFQEPPELIGDFIARWRAGATIVLATRASEKMSPLLRLVRAIGYGFFERYGDYRVIPNATGFGLYDRRVVDCLRKWRDPEPFFRGLLAETGFPIETIPYHRPDRAGGASKNNFWSLVSFGLSGLTSSSKFLLRLPIYISFLVIAAAFMTFVIGCALGVLGRSPWSFFWASIVEVGFALVFLFMGLIGEQVRLIYEIARLTPLVVERERVNFPPGSSTVNSEPPSSGNLS